MTTIPDDYDGEPLLDDPDTFWDVATNGDVRVLGRVHSGPHAADRTVTVDEVATGYAGVIWVIVNSLGDLATVEFTDGEWWAEAQPRPRRAPHGREAILDWHAAKTREENA